MSCPMVMAALSDVGRVRKENQDSWYADEDAGLFIVSDGMGGRPGGAWAASIVTEQIPELLKMRVDLFADLSLPKAQSAMVELILEVNANVVAAAATKPGHSGMGATVVLALIRGHLAIVAHMGDSRAYLHREGELIHLTKDHSIVTLLMENGEITEEEARTHPSRSQITRYMGMKEVVGPDVSLMEMETEDRLLLCSDGLTGPVVDTVIAHYLRKTTGPKAACSLLVDEANRAGGRDNITTLIIDWHDEEFLLNQSTVKMDRSNRR